MGFGSCTPTFTEVVAVGPMDQSVNEDSVVLTARYGLDAGDHLVFELDVNNGSNDELFISAEDVMLVVEDEDEARSHRLPAVNKDRLLDHLEDEKVILRKEKRTQGVLSAIGVGIGVVAMAVDPGSFSTADRIFYAAEATAGIVGEQRSFTLAEGDIDDQILYVEDWVMDTTTIAPGEEQSWDLLFTNPIAAGSATLLVEVDGRPLAFDFTLELAERRE
ncbi:MAG: hypothetical protein KTR24_11110 [Saprospiraceae bacterium]|nr:hypothetical protein [Saprospiraceae bacterium]